MPPIRFARPKILRLEGIPPGIGVRHTLDQRDIIELIILKTDTEKPHRTIPHIKSAICQILAKPLESLIPWIRTSGTMHGNITDAEDIIILGFKSSR